MSKRTNANLAKRILPPQGKVTRTGYKSRKSRSISAGRANEGKKVVSSRHSRMDEGMMDEAPTSPLALGDLRAVSVLGRGAKGVVFQVHHRSSSSYDQAYALKAISRSNIERRKKESGSDQYRRILFEREVISGFRHPLLPALRGVVSTDEIVGFTIDRCSGGDLSSLQKRQTEEMFSEDIIRFYAAELVLALEHLHGLGIVYRDLKPENILIQDNGHLMLVDFDLSTRLTPQSSPINTPDNNNVDKPSKQRVQSLPYGKQKRRVKTLLLFPCATRSAPGSLEQDATTTETASTTYSSSSSSGTSFSGLKSNSFVGTEEYVAPEVIDGTGHDFSVDWWSLGVVLYEMLYGRTPFRGENRKETFYRILSMTPMLVGERTHLRDLIRKLLEKDPNKRIQLEAIKSHEFFRGVEWESVLQISRPPFIPAAQSGGGSEDVIDVENFVRRVFAGDNYTTTAAAAAAVGGGGTAAAAVGTGKGNWEQSLTNNATPSPETFLAF